VKDETFEVTGRIFLLWVVLIVSDAGDFGLRDGLWVLRKLCIE